MKFQILLVVTIISVVSQIHLTCGLEDVTSKNETISSRLRPIAPAPRAVFPFYVTASVRRNHDKIFRKIFDTILAYGLFYNNVAARALPPFNFIPPHKVVTTLDFELQQHQGEEQSTMVNDVKIILQNSPRASHPYRLDRHGGGLDPYGILGDWMATAMGAVVITYFASPTYMLMEFEVWQKTRELIGYPDGKGDGMTVPGAGMGNAYIVPVALEKKFPGFKRRGILPFLLETGSSGVVFFISEQASFSYDKFAVWQGIGEEGMIKVGTDERGRMNVTDLEVKIKEAQAQKKIGFLIVATAGTAVLGAIDPIDEISAVSKKYQMWLHVDGQIAGTNFFSTNHIHRLAGVEKADSFLWSADKGLSAPFTTTILVTRYEDSLKNAFGIGSSLVFHEHPLYNSFKWDNGDMTMQCTRRPEIMKIWFMWKAKGKQMLGQHIDHTYRMTKFASEELARRIDSFTPVLDEFDSPMVAFYYTPRVLQCLPKALQIDAIVTTKYTEKLKVALLQHGKLTISFGSNPMWPSIYFVMSLMNSVVQEEDISYIFDQFEIYGEDPLLIREVIDYLVKENIRFSLPDESDLNSNSFLITDENSSKQPKLRRILRSEPPRPLAKYPDYVSAAIESQHKSLFKNFIELILGNATYYQDKRHLDVAVFTKPEDLLKKFDFSLPINNESGIVGTEGAEEKLLDVMRGVIKYSAPNGHPYYLFHMGTSQDPFSMMADYVATVVDSPMILYEDNPIFTQMEAQVINGVRHHIGYKEHDEVFGSGCIVPGGSAAIQIAHLLATNAKVKDFKKSGLQNFNKTLVAFTSVAGHYSPEKGAAFQGIGMDNVIKIREDRLGRMDMADLKAKVKAAVEHGEVPFIVVATTGTTALGAYDPVEEIADVCQEYGMWLHIDGSYGGGALYSANETRRLERFKGIERSNSFNINPHKALSMVREVSIFVTRQSGALKKVAPNASVEEFNNALLYDGLIHDPGTYNLFTDRRPGVVKAWFMRKFKGLEGVAQHVDYGYDLTQLAVKEFEKRKDAFLLHPTPPQSAHVNFYYIPKKYRNLDRDSSEFWIVISYVQSKVTKALVEANSFKMEIKPGGLRAPSIILPLYYSALSVEDVAYILDFIDYLCQDME